MALAEFATSTTLPTPTVSRGAPAAARLSAAGSRSGAPAHNKAKHSTSSPSVEVGRAASGGTHPRAAGKEGRHDFSGSEVVDVVLPRRKAGCLDLPQRNPIVVTPEVLESLFEFPLAVASKRLGLSATTIKKLCRKIGIAKWPYKSPTRSGARTSPVLLPATPEHKEDGDNGASGEEGADDSEIESMPHTTPSSPVRKADVPSILANPMMLQGATPAQQDQAKQNAMVLSMVNTALASGMLGTGGVEQVQELLRRACAGTEKALLPPIKPPRCDVMSIDALL